MDAETRLARARVGLVRNAPFYATLAMTVDLQSDDTVETMCTNGAWIKYSPAFVDTLSDAELRGVLAHECGHIANLHHTRRGSRDPEMWNVAADYVLNAQLVADGFTLPDGALLSPVYDGMSTEQVYAALSRDAKSGKPTPDGSGMGEVIDAAPESDKAALQAAEMKAKARTIQAAQAAKAAGDSGGAGQALARAHKRSAVDWRAVLRRFVDSAARTEYVWHRPNRRHVASGVYLPGQIPDGMGHLAVIIDVSGSLDHGALNQFLSEIDGAVGDASPDCVTVLQCNRQVIARDTFGAGEPVKVTVHAGGGTNMQPALDETRDASAVIVFTDCVFSKQPDTHGTPTLWARWGGGGIVPTQGELVDIAPQG